MANSSAVEAKKAEVSSMNEGGRLDRRFEVGGARARYVLIICSLLYAVNWMDRQVFSVVAAPMMEALQLTKAQVGWIQNFFLLSIGLLAIPVSYLVDRWSRSKAIAAMAVVWSAATFVTGLGRSFVGVMLPRLVVGAGEAGFGPGGTALIAASYPPDQRGHKLGYFNMCISVGVIAGLIAGGFIAKAWGWAAPFFVFAVPGIILGIMALWMQDYPTLRKPGAAESIVKNSMVIWKTPTLRWVYLGYGLYMLTILAVSHWNTAMLMYRFKLTVAQAPLIMAGVLTLTLFAAPVGGWLADKWERKTVGGRMRYAALCSLGASVCAVLYFYFTFILYKGTFGEMGPLLVVGLLLYLAHTLFIGGIGGTVGATTQMVVPPNLRSLSFGWAMTCMYALGGGWGSGIAGSIADAVGTGKKGDWLGLAYGVMITCSFGILACLAWWRASQHYGRDFRKVTSSGR